MPHSVAASTTISIAIIWNRIGMCERAAVVWLFVKSFVAAGVVVPTATKIDRIAMQVIRKRIAMPNC